MAVDLETGHPVCPRCEGYIPNNNQPGAYPGAWSRKGREYESTLRLDKVTYVCSTCGIEEALVQMALGMEGLEAEEWPIETPAAVERSTRRTDAHATLLERLVGIEQSLNRLISPADALGEGGVDPVYVLQMLSDDLGAVIDRLRAGELA